MPRLLMVSSAVVYINTECVSDSKHRHHHLAPPPSWVSGVCNDSPSEEYAFKAGYYGDKQR